MICLSIRSKKVTTIYGVGKKTNIDGEKMMGIFEKCFFISFLYFSLNNKDYYKINERSFSERGFGAIFS